MIWPTRRPGSPGEEVVLGLCGEEVGMFQFQGGLGRVPLTSLAWDAEALDIPQ